MQESGVSRAKQRCVLALLGLLLPSLLALQPSAARAAQSSDEVWVLTETLVNPLNAQTEYYGGGVTPGWFTEPRFEGKFTKYSVSDSSLGIEDRQVDHGYEYHLVSIQASLQKPPAELVPGQTVELTATFSHSGSAEDAGIGVLFWYSGKGVRMQPADAFGYAPWSPAFDGTASATYTFVVPAALSGGELEIYASLWNAEPSLVVWKYQAKQSGGEGPSPEPEAEGEEPPAEAEPRKPVIILPGIYGSYVASAWSSPIGVGTWIYSRGIDPNLLAIDPLAHFYDDIIVTLKNAGYVEGRDLFIGAYDWRVPPGPVDGAYDGVIQGISGSSITDDLYEYGVDYLGHYLKQAAERWRQDHDGEVLDSVDIISHSTGGLVARVYIQGTAYGQHFRASDGAAVRLPRVNNLIMVAVPNRGAALPWQAMNNNFKRDLASKYVMSKIIAGSYLKVLKGATIAGPPAPITFESIRDPSTGRVDPVKFINLYCPTFRSLLATYPFIRKPDGSLVDMNGLPEYRNDLVLDLNNGLDLPGRPAPADPNPFAGAVNHTTVFYATRKETVHQVQEMNTAASNALFPLDATFEQDVAAGTTWYQDIVEVDGDGTVPSASAAGQFKGDGRIELIEVIPGDVSHTGLMANRRVQTAILNVLGIGHEGVEISTGLASEGYANIIAAVSDPVGFLLVDGQGRRLGWTPDTGILSEMPNSVWYGEGDGIGFVFGEVPQPLRVELVGLGDGHVVQVVGEQGEQRIGLEDGGSLASGEKRSVEVAVRGKLSLPASPATQASESKDSTFAWLIGLVVALSVLVAGALVVIGIRLRKRGHGAPPRPKLSGAPSPAHATAQRPPAAAAVCPRCGSAVRPEGGFCGACGASVAPVTPKAEQPADPQPAQGAANRAPQDAARPTCPHCGGLVVGGAHFCGHCGRSLS